MATENQAKSELTPEQIEARAQLTTLVVSLGSDRNQQVRLDLVEENDQNLFRTRGIGAVRAIIERGEDNLPNGIVSLTYRPKDSTGDKDFRIGSLFMNETEDGGRWLGGSVGKVTSTKSGDRVYYNLGPADKKADGEGYEAPVQISANIFGLYAEDVLAQIPVFKSTKPKADPEQEAEKPRSAPKM